MPSIVCPAYYVTTVGLKHEEQVGLLQRCISLFTFARSKLLNCLVCICVVVPYGMLFCLLGREP